MDASEYIKESEHAVRQLFEGAAYYRQILQEMPNPVFVSGIPFDDKDLWNEAFSKWYEENKTDIERSREKSHEYFGLSFSNATLCGSILQIASMAIDSFSQNEEVPESCSGFVNSGQKAVKSCIGREVRGLPVGIVIYAARNQYNHWDDPNQRRITQAVFDALALGHGYGPVRDPAFDLSNPKLDIYSHNILTLLEWSTYEDYETDIRTLILP
ncbi:hypothetical protein [Methylobacter marinus]|uniref:hypothetical protein n=1 Tax=Methylobacter marinus TaxID=34058 RepID=UPI00037F6952|nr:hypothetical protein [Methylobacter marinus]